MIIFNKNEINFNLKNIYNFNYKIKINNNSIIFIIYIIYFGYKTKLYILQHFISLSPSIK